MDIQAQLAEYEKQIATFKFKVLNYQLLVKVNGKFKPIKHRKERNDIAGWPSAQLLEKTAEIRSSSLQQLMEKYSISINEAKSMKVRLLYHLKKIP